MVVRKYHVLLRYAFRQWRRLLVLVALSGLGAAVAALQPWPMKLLVDYALGHGADEALPAAVERLLSGVSPAGLVLVAAAATLLLFVVNSLLGAGLTLTWAVAGRRMVCDVAEELFRRLQRFSLLFHNRRHVGDSLTLLTKDSWSVITLTDALLIGPLRHLIVVITIGVVAWRLDPGLTLLSLTIIPVMGASARFFGLRLLERARSTREAQSQLFSFLQQTLTVVPMVQSFGAETRNTGRFRQMLDIEIGHMRRDALTRSGFAGMKAVIPTVGTAVILYFGGLRVLAGTLSIGSLLVFLAYLRTMQQAIKGLFDNYSALRSAEANLERVLEVFETEEQVREVAGARPLPAIVCGQGARVRLERVVFGYEEGRPILHEIDLEVPPGQTLALVGPTGAGKSTLISLLPRFFDPWQGRVLVQGTDVREVQLQSLRAQIALVLQEALVLPVSIAENIAYGRPEASRAEIEAVARAANAHQFIEQLPQGYDTVIGERGATLSGGERQRLSIARAFLKDAPILILDEPTSALDAGTEVLVMEALERLMRGRTVLVIAHRLSTVRRADQIAVLQQGRIVELGSHEQLLAANGPYLHLHNAQFDGPVPDAAA
jgi:ATP-binding cassette, subfamily B, bacterial